MNDKAPNITIPVDLTNPGQFFACCGLLELADRLWPGGEVCSRFELHRFDRARFCVDSPIDFNTQSIVTALLKCSRVAVDPIQPVCGSDGKPTNDAAKTQPVMIGTPVKLRLNWWLDELSATVGDFKTWGSHQKAIGILNDMANEVDPVTATDNAVFRTPVGMTGRFGFDPRSSWVAGDTGFSPNDQVIPVETYPAVELLAAIGLQTYTPATDGNAFSFAPWEQLLPNLVARAAANGVLCLPDARSYRFTVLSRGKFKFFSKAQRLTRSNHD